MHGGIAREALEAFRHVDKIMDLLILLVPGLQVRIHRNCPIQRDVQLLGDHLGDLIRLRVGQVEDAGYVTDDTAGSHRTERNDLNDPVPPVLPNDIVDDLLSALEAEIHIDIRHGHALRIQEAFKDQIVFERVEVRDAERVGYNGAGRTAAARSDRDSMVPGKFDVIPYNKEVIDEAHPADRVQFVRKALLHLLRHGVISFLYSFPAQFTQIRIRIVPLRHIVFRELALTERDCHVAPLRYFFRVVDRFRHKAEEFPHLIRGFHIILSALVAQTVLIHDFLSRLNAEQDVMRVHILPVCIVTVICADQRKAFLVVHPDQLAVDMLLLRDPVILQLEEKVVLPENLPVLKGSFFCPLIIPAHDCFRNLTCKAGRQADNALVIYPKQLFIDARLVIKPVDKTAGDDFHEVLIPFIVLGQKDQVIVSILSCGTFPVKAAFRGDVDLTAENRFDSLLHGLPIEIDTPVHDAVVRNCAGCHPELFDLGYIFRYFVGAVQQRIFRVDVKVGERHSASSLQK